MPHPQIHPETQNNHEAIIELIRESGRELLKSFYEINKTAKISTPLNIKNKEDPFISLADKVQLNESFVDLLKHTTKAAYFIERSEKPETFFDKKLRQLRNLFSDNEKTKYDVINENITIACDSINKFKSSSGLNEEELEKIISELFNLHSNISSHSLSAQENPLHRNNSTTFTNLKEIAKTYAYEEDIDKPCEQDQPLDETITQQTNSPAITNNNLQQSTAQNKVLDENDDTPSQPITPLATTNLQQRKTQNNVTSR